MSVTNHLIRPEYDLDLAMIEHTKVMAFCGETMFPTVTPGTSGRADVPRAPKCEPCNEAVRISREWSLVKRERNRLNRELRTLEKAYRSLVAEQSERSQRTLESTR